MLGRAAGAPEAQWQRVASIPVMFHVVDIAPLPGQGLHRSPRQQLTSLEQAGESRCEGGLDQGQLAPARPQPGTIKTATQATCADKTRSDHQHSRARAAPASHDADCAYNTAQDRGLWFCSPRALPSAGAEPGAKRYSSTRSVGSSGAETSGKSKGFALLRTPGRSFNGMFCALALCICTLHTHDVDL